MAAPDLEAIRQLRLMAPALNRLALFVGGIVANRDGTAAGA